MLATSRFSPMGLRLLRHGDGLVDAEDILHAESGAGPAVLPRVLPAGLQQGDCLSSGADLGLVLLQLLKGGELGSLRHLGSDLYYCHNKRVIL